MKGSEIVQELTRLSETLLLGIRKVASALPHVDPDTDARVAALSAIRNCVDAVRVGVIFRQAVSISDEDTRIVFLQYVQQLVMSLAGGTFMSTEAGFRSLHRVLEPQHSGGAPLSFSKVYRTLLSRLGLTSYTPLLQLMCEVRNCVHNNFFYFPPGGQGRTIRYKGADFSFTVGEPLSFAGWPFFLQQTADIAEMLERVMLHPEILRLTTIRASGMVAVLKANGEWDFR